MQVLNFGMRMWSGDKAKKFFTDPAQVLECFRQQVAGLYDHIHLDGSAFELRFPYPDLNGREVYEGDYIWFPRNKALARETPWIIQFDGGVAFAAVDKILSPWACSIPETLELKTLLDNEFEVLANIHEYHLTPTLELEHN